MTGLIQPSRHRSPPSSAFSCPTYLKDRQQVNDLLHVKQNRSTKSIHGPLSEVSLYSVSGQLTIAGHEAPRLLSGEPWHSGV